MKFFTIIPIILQIKSILSNEYCNPLQMEDKDNSQSSPLISANQMDIFYKNWHKENDLANNCITFTVGSGTGCAWMCEYCQTNLGTTNYYFTDGICTYNNGGCIGNPIAGHQYTCCIL